MSGKENRHDDVFSMLLNHHKNNVPDLLHSMASFLSRKTDFFIDGINRDLEKEEKSKEKINIEAEEETDENSDQREIDDYKNNENVPADNRKEQMKLDSDDWEKYTICEVKCPELSWQDVCRKMNALVRQGDIKIERKLIPTPSCKFSDLQVSLEDCKRYKVSRVLAVDSEAIEIASNDSGIIVNLKLNRKLK